MGSGQRRSARHPPARLTVCITVMVRERKGVWCRPLCASCVRCWTRAHWTRLCWCGQVRWPSGCLCRRRSRSCGGWPKHTALPQRVQQRSLSDKSMRLRVCSKPDGVGITPAATAPKRAALGCCRPSGEATTPESKPPHCGRSTRDTRPRLHCRHGSAVTTLGARFAPTSGNHQQYMRCLLHLLRLRLRRPPRRMVWVCLRLPPDRALLMEITVLAV